METLILGIGLLSLEPENSISRN